MLSMSDTPLEQFSPIFAELGVPVAFLVPTATGFQKSIMDATAPVRKLLLDAGLHDYSAQGQGRENKVKIPAYIIVGDSVLAETTASVYRPVTKHGDPRIWFSNLKKYCDPYNLLALITIGPAIYLFNLSDAYAALSLRSKGFAYHVLQEAARGNAVAAKKAAGKTAQNS